MNYDKINQYIQLLSISDSLMRLYNRNKDPMVLDHYTWNMDRASDMLGSMEEQECNYCMDVYCDIMEDRLGADYEH